MKYPEQHFTHRGAWLRASVLGANDGIVSTASLVVGVAAAEAGRGNVRVTFWGVLAMALTAGIGKLFGAVNL